MDTKLTAYESFLAADGTFDQAGMMTKLYNAMSIEMFIFGLDGGFPSAAHGPPTACQAAMYMYLPPGAMTGKSITMQGQASYVVYDSLFQYKSDSFKNGVGKTTDYTGVKFSTLKGGKVTKLAVSGTNLDKTVDGQMCVGATDSNNQVCLKLSLAAKDFTKDGLKVSTDAAKTDVFANNLKYDGANDSPGYRMIVVSSSFSGTVTIDDSGDSDQNQETFGAAYLITSKKVDVKATKIDMDTYTGGKSNGLTKKDVTENKQTIGAEGKECGYTKNDWWNQKISKTDDKTKQVKEYANAKDFFEKDMKLTTIKCLMFSFNIKDAAQKYVVWDPIVGIDKGAAKKAAEQGSGKGTGSGAATAGASMLAAAVAVMSALTM